MRTGVTLALTLMMLAGVVQADGFKVVVHEDNPIESISKSELSAIFLKRRTKWSSGRAVAAVDLPRKSQVREEFTIMVHRKRPSAVASYWNQMIFSGRGTPPMQVRSDAEVLNFVGGNRDAIGYVAASTDNGQLPVKTIELVP